MDIEDSAGHIGVDRFLPLGELAAVNLLTRSEGLLDATLVVIVTLHRLLLSFNLSAKIAVALVYRRSRSCITVEYIV